jgi:hypothetical protein
MVRELQPEPADDPLQFRQVNFPKLPAHVAQKIKDISIGGTRAFSPIQDRGPLFFLKIFDPIGIIPGAITRPVSIPKPGGLPPTPIPAAPKIPRLQPLNNFLDDTHSQTRIIILKKHFLYKVFTLAGVPLHHQNDIFDVCNIVIELRKMGPDIYYQILEIINVVRRKLGICLLNFFNVIVKLYQ